MAGQVAFESVSRGWSRAQTAVLIAIGATIGCAVAAPVAVHAQAPAAPCYGAPPLREGSSGEDVRWLQVALERLGYDIGDSGADGHFGPATRAAVEAWQASLGRPVTGEVDCDMWPLVTQNLESGDEDSAPEEPADQSQPATPDDVGDEFPLGRGSSGARVAQLQQWLMAAGFDVGASGADGHLGPATQAAVTAWQTANGLAGTGILTADQWPLLESSSQGESAETAVAPVAGEPVVVVTTTNHNQATEAFVVGASGAVRPLPGIDPMGEVGGIAISTDSTTIYRAIDGTLTSIDALTLATTASVACGECRDLLVLGDGGVATVDGGHAAWLRARPQRGVRAPAASAGRRHCADHLGDPRLR